MELAAIRNRKLGFIFQAYNLLPRTSALRNVTLPLLYNHTGNGSLAEGDEKGRQMLELVGLGDRINHQPQELSGGRPHRGHHHALINNPVVVIADEPTGNLDSHSGEEIMALLHSLNAQGTTIVMVTHDPKIAAHTQRTVNLMDGLVDNVVHNGKSHLAEVQHETV